MNEKHVLQSATALSINPRQVAATAALLAEGATVPFIARYRKERTGQLDEVQITNIRDSLARLTGVSYPPILGITVAVALLVIKILLMDLERSRIEMRNQRLIQRVAILEADIRDCQDQQQAPKSKDSSPV